MNKKTEELEGKIQRWADIIYWSSAILILVASLIFIEVIPQSIGLIIIILLSIVDIIGSIMLLEYIYDIIISKEEEILEFLEELEEDLTRYL
jgi:hypothetical protein